MDTHTHGHTQRHMPMDIHTNAYTDTHTNAHTDKYTHVHIWMHTNALMNT